LIQSNSNKQIIILDDEQEVVSTYKNFLIEYDYRINSFTDPYLALNYIRDSHNHNDLLVILDIRMKKINGLQFYQQIKTIDPTIKILFITALDIIDELLTIVPGLSKEQIMRKPVDKTEFIKNIKKIFG
jgi:DNA-binding NtrC family response regulator